MAAVMRRELPDSCQPDASRREVALPQPVIFCRRQAHAASPFCVRAKCAARTNAARTLHEMAARGLFLSKPPAKPSSFSANRP